MMNVTHFPRPRHAHSSEHALPLLEEPLYTCGLQCGLQEEGKHDRESWGWVLTNPLHYSSPISFFRLLFRLLQLELDTKFQFCSLSKMG